MMQADGDHIPLEVAMGSGEAKQYSNMDRALAAVEDGCLAAAG